MTARHVDADLRTARRILGRRVPVEWLSGYVGAVLRVRTHLGERSCFAGELSCLVTELEAVKPWIDAGGVGPLPVPEYRQEPWGLDYRWTRAAHLVALEIEARRLELTRARRSA